MTMAWSSLLMLSLIPALSLASSEAEAGPEAVNIQIGGGTTLDCKEEPDKWIFNNNNTETTVLSVTDDGTYKFENDGKQLVLTNIQEASLGLYKCVGEDDEVIREFEVDSSFKLRGLPKSISVDDGTKAVIECKAKTATDDVTFKWFTIPEDWETNPSYVGPKPLCAKGSGCSSSDDVQPEALFDARDKSLPVAALEERAEVEELDEKGHAVSRLTIAPAYTEDRQYYVCQAVMGDESVEECNTPENKHCDEEKVLLRVKDPLAALYPFVGIVAEVIVLCVVIFFCERSKSEDKEDYEGVATGNGNPATSSNSNLRQRK